MVNYPFANWNIAARAHCAPSPIPQRPAVCDICDIASPRPMAHRQHSRGVVDAQNASGRGGGQNGGTDLWLKDDQQG